MEVCSTMAELETLKDIKKYLPEDPYCIMDTMEISTDNRTLNSKSYKLRKEKYDKHGFLSQLDLKQDAIKQVNELRKFDNLYCCSCDDDFGSSMEDNEGTQKWIMNYFNISEEDLLKPTQSKPL